METKKPPDLAADIARVVVQTRKAMVQLARQDPAIFAGFVMRDERTRDPITLAPIHTAWHELMTKHKRLVIWGHVESGKTQMAIARILYEIGHDPSLRVLVLCDTHTQAVKIVKTIGQYIESSAELHLVFPRLKPALTGWKPDSGAIQVRRDVFSKDPTVQAVGSGGHPLGSRVDLLVVDDLLSFENTLTPHLRDKTWSWFNANISGRLTENAKQIVIGNAHHPDDAMHQWAKNPGWNAYRYPVLDDNGNPRWPERWSLKRIAEARATMTPVEFSRQLMCVPRDDSTARFKQEWIDVGLKLGEGKKLCHAIQHVPMGCKTYTGVDLAVQKHAAADLTSLFTILEHSNGVHEILNIESGRWSGPDIVRRIFETHVRYHSILIVENNGAQDFIIQFASSQHALPIKPFTTGRNKAHPEFGIESIGAEMSLGKWIIPNEGGAMHPEVAAWVQELLFYDPQAHTGDRAMASWFAREGAGMTAAQGIAETGRLDLLSR